MTLIQYPQGQNDPEIVRQIVALENTAWPQDGEDEAFPLAPNTYVTSFVLMDEGRAICHVGIRKSDLHHKGQRYLAYGLSEVVTHPCRQNQGLASGLIQKAAQFILEQHPDLSIFTCEPGRVPLYTRGGWQATEGACFVGGTREKPFRSDSLHLSTMIRFISPHAIRHQADFENTDIVFELGENQLW